MGRSLPPSGKEETSHPAYLDAAVVSVQEKRRIFQTPLKARPRPSEQSDSRSTMDFGLMMDGNTAACCRFIVRYNRLINSREVFTRVVYINVLINTKGLKYGLCTLCTTKPFFV